MATRNTVQKRQVGPCPSILTCCLASFATGWLLSLSWTADSGHSLRPNQADQRLCSLLREGPAPTPRIYAPIIKLPATPLLPRDRRGVYAAKQRRHDDVEAQFTTSSSTFSTFQKNLWNDNRSPPLGFPSRLEAIETGRFLGGPPPSPSGFRTLPFENDAESYLSHYVEHKGHFFHADPLVYTGFPAHAFCYLFTHESLLKNLLVSEMSFQSVGTTIPRVVLVTPNVLDITRLVMTTMNLTVVELPSVISIPKSFAEPVDPKWINAIYKFEAYRLTQASRLVSIDLDTIVLHNVDDLFNTSKFPGLYYYGPDNWECLNQEWKVNSAVQVLTPSLETYRDINRFMADATRRFGQGDQEVSQRYWRSRIGPAMRSLGERYHTFWRRCLCPGQSPRRWNIVHLTPRDDRLVRAMFFNATLPSDFPPCAAPFAVIGRRLFERATRILEQHNLSLDYLQNHTSLQDAAYLTAQKSPP